MPHSDLPTAPSKPSANGFQRANNGSPTHNKTYEDAEKLDLEDLCAQLNGRVMTFLDTKPETKELADVQRQTKISLNVIEDALRRYSLSQLSFSYNGGKDCLVLLIIYLVALHNHFKGSNSTSSLNKGAAPSTQAFPRTLKSIYIVSPNPFQEVDDFAIISAEYYSLSLLSCTQPMKEAFEAYLQSQPEVEAIFVGTRRTDPHGAHLDHFQETDGGWPRFMRIHPVIDWHYKEIWSFILYFGIPYCPLYDLGYTSLGSKKDTNPNPALKSQSAEVGGEESRFPKYRPAYELMDDSEERLGRG